MQKEEGYVDPETGEIFASRPRLDEYGREILDDTPVSLPVRLKRGENIAEQVQRLVQQELSRLADAQGLETFEEANDFDVGDDYDPRSEYEVDEFHDENYFSDRDDFYQGRLAGPSQSADEGNSEANRDSEQGGEKTSRSPKGASDGE